jgi:O-acetyl-ADP-ribose deacetylase (regulator of RNase III)
VKRVVGDIVKITRNNPGIVVVHGCNCYHTMGAGVAKELSRAFPMVLEADKESKYADPFKMGTYTSATTPNGTTIVNAYTQYDHGNGIHVDYGSIRKAFKAIREEFGDRPIYYPKIGAGLGGGDWRIIKGIIEKELDGCDHTLIVWELDPEALEIES